MCFFKNSSFSLLYWILIRLPLSIEKLNFFSLFLFIFIIKSTHTTQLGWCYSHFIYLLGFLIKKCIHNNKSKLEKCDLKFLYISKRNFEDLLLQYWKIKKKIFFFIFNKCQMNYLNKNVSYYMIIRESKMVRFKFMIVWSSKL